eukprot:jgi/Bigna1/88481/estExt_fgenesh1_pg.C_320146
MASVHVDGEEDYEESEATDHTDVTEETDTTQFDKKSEGKKKTKGRGFKEQGNIDSRYQGRSGRFSGVDSSKVKNGNLQSVEGWILFIRGIHEEAQEEDVYDLFADYGEIKQLHLNLDRRTGYVKGYSLIEYEKYEEAESAVKALNGTELLEREIQVEFAFKPTKKKK